MTMNDIPACRLCLTRPADKKNSHIITKFLTKALFEDVNPRHSLAIDRGGKGRKIQDTPKEDHILCSVCEKRLEIVETEVAPFFRDLYNYSQKPALFKPRKLGVTNFLECTGIHPTLYKLFIFSLIWRASISRLYEFGAFHLSQESEEALRFFLNTNLASDRDSLIRNVDAVKHTPAYDHCCIVPIQKNRGVYSCANIGDTTHVLFLVHFAIFFYSDHSAANTLKIFSNSQNRTVIVALTPLADWESFKQIATAQTVNARRR